MAFHHHHAIHAIEKAYKNSGHQRFRFNGHHLESFDGRVLDVNGANGAEGTKVIYYDKKPGNSPNQGWEHKDGFLYSRMGTGLVIDISGAKIADGSELIMWKPKGSDNANQKWDIDAHGYIRSRANPDYVIDVNGGPNPAKGETKISLWKGHLSNGDSQLLTKLGQHANQRFWYDGNHIHGFDGRVLDVDGANSAKGTKLIFYDRKPGNSPNQTWDYKDGYFITRMGTGFCIDISGAQTKDGAELILWDRHDGSNQKWDIDGYGFIRSRANNKFVIDVNGGPNPKQGSTPVSLWSAAL